MVGGVFFSTGGYAGVLLAINAPHRRRDGGWARAKWRWWAREPSNYDYLAAAVLFAGTIVFGINLVDSLLGHLTQTQENRLSGTRTSSAARSSSSPASWRWSTSRAPGRPGKEGQACAARASAGGSSSSTRSARSSSWSPAVASFVRADGDLIAVGIANWGTLTGALCFAAAGFAQFYEPPDGS
jgi:hypothetical protein